MEILPDKRDLRIAELEAENARLRGCLKERELYCAKLAAQLEQALKRIDQLERQLGLNSQNSLKPPSSDGPKQRAQRKKKENGKRAQGAQKGHPGHHRELWPPEKVDHQKQYFPTNCSECGLELAAEDARGEPVRHQVFEVPPKLIECTEHQRMACECPGCGHRTRAKLPEAAEKSGWGPRLVGLLATLGTLTTDTRRQLDWFVGEVLGAPSSLGCVQRHLEEASAALKPGFDQACTAIQRAEQVGVDETGWRKGRLPHWIWVIQSAQAAVYRIRSGRTKAVAQEIIGAPGARIFVTDRYGAYSYLAAERHQICHAHLLREFVKMSELDGEVGQIGKKLEVMSRELQGKWARTNADEIPHEKCVIWVRQKVRPKWEALLKKAAAHGKAAPAVVRWLLKDKHLKMAWVFLEHPGVEMTNNASERALRGPVVQRKISWGSQSNAGLRMMERLWTIAETCKRQSISALDYITQAVEALRNEAPAPLLIA
ncbi:IS66 family transposase [Bradymonas sediminis]|uniref:IS66 family transposase n=1 Tax=Bradymonas sediminis TaxID=1548548 RepID=UPI0010E9ECAE|nr:IS66 family transposase [Bradymonas sediminis]TDP61426.1 transposase IS66 family protein [Bradymonas sediminis]